MEADAKELLEEVQSLISSWPSANEITKAKFIKETPSITERLGVQVSVELYLPHL
jgi:hypothetical protein